MSQTQLHNALIIESMFLAGMLIATGGFLTVIGIAWNTIILVANITGCDNRQKPVTKNQFNTVIFTAQRGEK